MEVLFVFIGIILALLLATLGMVAYVIARTVHPQKQITQPPKQLSEEEKRKAERLRREVINMLSYVGEPQEEIHID